MRNTKDFRRADGHIGGVFRDRRIRFGAAAGIKVTHRKDAGHDLDQTARHFKGAVLKRQKSRGDIR
jgi:hypothetical protein